MSIVEGGQLSAGALRQETKENLINTSKESALILIYELVGTAMMTLLISNYYAQKMESSAMIYVEGNDGTPKEEHVDL